MTAKRLLDVSASAAVLLLSAPLAALIAVAVRSSSPGPILHRAVRVGRNGEPFVLLKFRTMVAGAADLGAGITAGGDPRITTVGRWLRRSKLDELPQLANVLRGEMTLVGPRPEDARYVEGYSDAQRRILDFTPGLTSPATLAYRHEEDVLAAAADADRTYREVVLPEKLALDLAYFPWATTTADVRILARTLRAVVQRGKRSPAHQPPPK